MSKEKLLEVGLMPTMPGLAEHATGKLRAPGEPSKMAKEVGMDHVYNNMAWSNIIQSSVGVLRARLLNLVDSSVADKEQRAAMKGLLKDFFNQTYYSLLREMENFLVDYNVLPEEVVSKIGSQGFDELKRYEEDSK